MSATTFPNTLSFLGIPHMPLYPSKNEKYIPIFLPLHLNSFRQLICLQKIILFLLNTLDECLIFLYYNIVDILSFPLIAHTSLSKHSQATCYSFLVNCIHKHKFEVFTHRSLQACINKPYWDLVHKIPHILNLIIALIGAWKILFCPQTF